MTEPSSSTTNCTFLRARKRPAAASLRQRRQEDDDPNSSADDDSDQEGSDDEGNVVVRVRRDRRRGGLEAGGNRASKKRIKDAEGDRSSGSDDEKEAGESVGVSFKGTGDQASAGPSDMGATATVEIDTDQSRDARAIEERAREVRANAENPLEDKVYRGINQYAKFIEKRDSAAGSAAKMSTGPQRAPANIRATVRWDYAPDICKDYKETGFCGFGDSCKFMHDRSDYKFGWQLEREINEGTYGQDDDDEHKYEISSDDEDLPFKCFICKESFTAPVVTKCSHYFCEKCALEHYKKSQRCFACGKQTNGVFNPAKNLIAKMDKLKQEEAAEKAEDESDSD